MNIFIITPCGRESDILQKHIDNILSQVENLDIKLNFIIDHFTNEETIKILELNKNLNENIDFFHNNLNKRGVAGCYLKGYVDFLKSNNDYVLEMDIQSHDPKSIINFINKAKKGYKIILGSRNLHEGENLSSIKRKIVSRIGNILSRIFLNLNLSDSTSGFQMYHKDVIKELDLNSFISTSFLFQTEMKFKCISILKTELENKYKYSFYKKHCLPFSKNSKYKYVEVPFSYKNSKSNLSYKKIIQSFIEFIKLVFKSF